MTMTSVAIGDSDLPAMLSSRDVADIFKRRNLAVYAEARREFFRKVNLNPFKPHSQYVLQLLDWSFQDWFSFDCLVSASGITGDESEDLRIELEYDANRGISPFLAIGEYLHADCGKDGIDEHAVQDLREVNDTNFASIFWIRDAHAASGRLMVEDLLHGELYSVFDPRAASQYDGARGGMIVNRIAHNRGMWRSCAIPLYEARRPDSEAAGVEAVELFRDSGYTPDFVGLVRFFYGRAKDTGLGWEDAVSRRNTSMLDRFLNRICA
ncbi:hypothetical protein [Bifidobacterium felsineum]|nr:hypothetical protein [Bifidobacterium felsineum]MBT1163273.1 hypothetical protein [Bifidobacterium felsineum]